MSARRAPLCLLGDAIVDLTLLDGAENKLRLGGVCHAARALWAAGLPYRLLFFAPEYLTEQVRRFAAEHGAVSCEQVGTVHAAPNVMVIAEATEAGDQGYELLLRDERQVQVDRDRLASLVDGQRVLMLGDAITVEAVGRLEAEELHLDADVDPAWAAGTLGGLRSFITSTSEEVARQVGSPQALADAVVGSSAERLLFKENRGGSRLFSAEGELECPAHVRPVVHSVGVGDAFDAVWLSLRDELGDGVALAYASALAAEYASSTYPDVIAQAMCSTLRIPPEEMATMQGVRVPWAARAGVHVYIAAPDFDWVDQRPVQRVADALAYHGFIPHRPVQEIGQLAQDAGAGERRRVLEADLELLERCQLLVCVLLHDDPGTLVELGIAHQQGKPTVVYDPYGRARNPFVRDLPALCSSSLDEVIGAVFEQVGRTL